MSGLSSERMLVLMAYADGELSGDERLEVERSLQSDIDALRFVNEIAGLGDLVLTGHRESKAAQATASFDIADSVIATIGREAVPPKRAVASLDAARARRSKSFTTLAMAAAALAFAASFVMVMRSRSEAPLAPVASASAEPGVDVDLGESPGESVRVFYLSSDNSPTTSVVVWVDESGGNK